MTSCTWFSPDDTSAVRGTSKRAFAIHFVFARTAVQNEPLMLGMDMYAIVPNPTPLICMVPLSGSWLKSDTS